MEAHSHRLPVPVRATATSSTRPAGDRYGISQLKVNVKTYWKTLEEIFFKNTERKNYSKVGKFGRRHSLKRSHNDTIINCNKSYFHSIIVDPNHTNFNQPITANLTNIISIHDSAYIRTIEKVLASLVHSPVHSSPIFLYGSKVETLSPLHDSSTESVKNKGNPKPHKNTPNMVL